MTTKELIVGSALLVGAAFAVVGTSDATLAHTYYHHHHHGLYNFYGAHSKPDVNRGGPGPRVGAGSGTGAGAER